MIRILLGLACYGMLAFTCVLIGTGIARNFADHWFVYTVTIPFLMLQVLISAMGIKEFFFE